MKLPAPRKDGSGIPNLRSTLPTVYRFAFIVFFVALTIGHSEAAAPNALKKGDRIVFLGDSITQAGARPGGYVSLVRDQIDAKCKELGVEVIGAGISGNKVTDLQERLDRDVIAKKPSIVQISLRSAALNSIK